MKLCEGCLVEKDYSAFQKDPSIADGHAEKCNECRGLKFNAPQELVDVCKDCSKTKLPTLVGKPKAYGITQSSVKKLGFATAVLKWVQAEYKCQDCKNQDCELSICKDGVVRCGACLRANNLRLADEKRSETVSLSDGDQGK